ncbi:saccharopine dehydrogenase family protein [Bogoriella caseilytica]|uniref:Short subunit dehydrogenase-like uncharacterized protein n=1 Tax=Bogoriella caseilytica TaxID=56055 RepID=A0A3N2BGN7_9MICO|nr:saccharopine dehydrogenase NADP-binding domain-containing protein [Bogoriella caseilytica]ROR74380.1 short subunit dehydrogenase-like uncharacterized protein [Bogoriella caseilytica]
MTTPGSAAPREHDLVIYGVTGFVGALVAEYLAHHAPSGVRIALAARSWEKAQAAQATLPVRAQSWPVLVADSTDADSLRAMVRSTRVLITTVGPYLRHGLPVVEACAAAGTHYADLTGEVPFIRQAMEFDELARNTGARIVHGCGYDSIPSDLGVLALHRQAAADGAGGLTRVLALARARGGISGGTVASVRGIVELAGQDAAVRRLLADPHSLSPDREAESSVRQPADFPAPSRLRDGAWVAPFPMASVNSRVVRRSNAVQGWSYGRDLRYGEAVSLGRGPRGALRAAGLSAAMAAGMGVLALRPAQALLDQLLPAAGTGPDEHTRAAGWFRTELRAVTESGVQYRAVVAGPGDPGYAATTVMLGESALALALDHEELPDRAGSLTPATAIGDVLIDRLRRAGHRYEVTARG